MRDRRPPRREKAHQDGDDAESGGPLLIWGVHAAQAALANTARPILRAWATDNAAQRLAGDLSARKISPERVTPKDLDRKLGADTVHQGVLLEAGPLPDHDLGELAGTIMEKGPLIVLDQVTDPHNVGAILRSSAVLGTAGVVMTRRHSPPMGGALAKAASGALELVPIAHVQNLARALAELKAAGVVVIGLDGTATELLDDALLGGGLEKHAVALVLGAEGRGLRHLTAETCDRLCKIGTEDKLASLNVSNAAAIALHIAAMGRRKKGTS